MRILLHLLLIIFSYMTGYAQNVMEIHVDKPGTLAEKLPVAYNLEKDLIVKITGELYNSDFTVFHRYDWKVHFDYSLDLSDALVDTIPEKAFFDLHLVKLVLPATLKSIEYLAFGGCDFLIEADFTLCSFLEYIGDYAFVGCHKLVKTNISSCLNLKEIGTSAFNAVGDSNEDGFSFDLGSCLQLEEIGEAAFHSSFLKSIILPSNLKTIGKQAFYYCFKLTDLELPESILVLGDRFCGGSPIAGIKTLTMKAKKTLRLLKSPFEEEQFKDMTLVVPVGTKSAYQSAAVWSKFENIREIGFYNIKVKCTDYGTVKIREEVMQNNDEILVPEANDVQIVFMPEKGYYTKQVKLGMIDVTKQLKNNMLTISDIIESKELSVVFDIITYSFRAIYNTEGGIIKINERIVQSGANTTGIGEEVQLTFIPKDGYHLKYVGVEFINRTNDVENNQLTISARDSYVSATFEENTTETYAVKVSYNQNGGEVKVNENVVTNEIPIGITGGTDIQISITPNKGYHLKQVMVGNTDMMGKMEDNLLVIPSVSENQEITIVFEKDVPVTYILKVTYSTGGNVKVNGQSVTSGQSVTASASTDVKVTITAQTGYHIKQVLLGNEDVTSQLSNNVLTISSISANKDVTVTFEKDALVTYVVEVTYSEGGSVQVNDQLVTSGNPGSVTASTDVKVAIIPNAGYRIRQVKLGSVGNFFHFC